MTTQRLALLIVGILGLLLLAGCVPVQPTAAATTNAGEARAMTAESTSTVKTYQLDDLTMEYEVFGEGQPVLLLHGWPSERGMMIDSYERIFREREGWQRVYVDLPGMGQTTGGSWIDSNDDVREVLIQFMDDAFPDQNFLIVGLSYGGYMARGVLHGLHERIDGMMLQVPNVAGPVEARILAPTNVIVRNPEGLTQFPEPLANFFGEVLVVQSDEVLERMWVMMPGFQSADEEVLGRIAENRAYSFDVDALATPYDKPVLILTGKHDNVTGYEQAGDLLQFYPRATYAVLDRAGHGLNMEQPALFELFMHEWLDRVEEEQARATAG